MPLVSTGRQRRNCEIAERNFIKEEKKTASISRWVFFMFYRLNFPASTSFGPSRVAKPFSPTIVEWMLSPCGFVRGNEGQWLEVIPFFQFTLRTTARVLIIIKSLTNRESAPQTIQFLSSSFSLASVLFLASFLSLFPHPLSILRRFSQFPYRSMDQIDSPHNSQSQTRDWDT